MLKVRVITTSSGANAVQIVRYVNRRRVVVKHIGSGHTQDEIQSLLIVAEEWISNHTHQMSFFPEKIETAIRLEDCEYVGFYYTFIYEVIAKLQDRIGYNVLELPMLNDLVVMRILEPASKLRSIELLKTYFGIKHRRQNFYESAPQWLKLKHKVEELTVKFAEKEFCFDYTLVFYDVTTLYFETFESDDLRKQWIFER